MKKLAITLLLFIRCFTYSQNLDKEYFVLGTLNDYMGRQVYSSSLTERIDMFYETEKPLMDTIIALFDNKILIEEDRKNYILKSEVLTQKLNNFYDFTFKSKSAKTYEDLQNKKMDSVFAGVLKENIFENKEQIYSFITGAYVRYKRNDDSTYGIFIANSRSKAKLLYEKLLELGCEDVNYTTNQNIPVGHYVTFKPTKELEKYLIRYDFLANLLIQNKDNYTKSQIDNYIKSRSKR